MYIDIFGGKSAKEFGASESAEYVPLLDVPLYYTHRSVVRCAGVSGEECDW